MSLLKHFAAHMGLKSTKTAGKLLRRLGGISCPCSLHWQPTPMDTVQAEVMLFSERPSLAVSTSRRFGYRDSGSVGFSYSDSGVGCETTFTRQLTERTQAQLSWSLGPQDESGMALALTHTRDRCKITGKVQVRQECKRKRRLIVTAGLRLEVLIA